MPYVLAVVWLGTVHSVLDLGVGKGGIGLYFMGFVSSYVGTSGRGWLYATNFLVFVQSPIVSRRRGLLHYVRPHMLLLLELLIVRSALRFLRSSGGVPARLEAIEMVDDGHALSHSFSKLATQYWFPPPSPKRAKRKGAGRLRLGCRSTRTFSALPEVFSLVHRRSRCVPSKQVDWAVFCAGSLELVDLQ